MCLHEIRRFQIPPLDATEYHDMVDWQTLVMMKPPVTIYLTDNDLNDMVPLQITQSVLFFSCHTHEVERFVKLTTEALAAV